MSKGLILYQSKYGATKQYADMLHRRLGYDVIETKHYRQADMDAYDTLLFAAGIYAGGIAGISLLRKHYDEWKKKRIVVLCVGASPYDEEAFEQIKQQNLRELAQSIPMFYGRGAWDIAKMSIKDLALCRLLEKMVKKKNPQDLAPWMKELLGTMDQKACWVSEHYLSELLACLNDPTVQKESI